MKIIFFGTPGIAVPYLEELLKTEEVAGVVTQPDKPSGRGKRVHAPPVKVMAQKSGIEVFQPVKFEQDLADRIKSLKPEAGIVVSYGKLIPENIFTLPFYGCFNVHFSLLPKYRGAAPVQWTLVNGEKETGVTTFWIEKTLDSGPVLLQKKCPVSNTDNAESLFAKLVPLGIETMKETIALLKRGQCKGNIQQGEPTSAPSIRKEDGKISWKAPAEKVYNLIRGMQPWPSAHTRFTDGALAGKTLKIFRAGIVSEAAPGKSAPGRIAGLDERGNFIVECGNGFLAAEEVQIENKNRMPARDFWRGGRVKIGDNFE